MCQRIWLRGVESLSYINLTVVYSSCNLVGATVSQTSGTRFAYYPDGHMDVLQPLVAAANTILGKITLTIKAQNGLKVVNYSNQGNNLLIDHEVGGIAYSLEGTGAFAGLTHSDTNGTLDGNDEVQMNDGARINWEP